MGSAVPMASLGRFGREHALSILGLLRFFSFFETADRFNHVSAQKLSRLKVGGINTLWSSAATI